jgi:dihydroxyacetone kinase-like protein
MPAIICGDDDAIDRSAGFVDPTSVEALARNRETTFIDISSAIDAQRKHLTALDVAIGGADHGITMSFGFNAVKNELSSMDLDVATASAVVTSAVAAFLNALGT